MLEGLVEEVYHAMGKDYLYKRDSRGHLDTRLANPSVGSSIQSFRTKAEAKSKLPHYIWQ